MSGLNTRSVFAQYKKTSSLKYFVDKTGLIKHFIPMLNTADQYICITRPRRFGKTTIAYMLASYFSKGFDASEVFDQLNISKEILYRQHLNQHNVISIDFSKMPEECSGYKEYIGFHSDNIKIICWMCMVKRMYV